MYNNVKFIVSIHGRPKASATGPIEPGLKNCWGLNFIYLF